MKKIIITEYNSISGKGKYRTVQGKTKVYHHSQAPGMLEPGTFAYIHKNGKIDPVIGLKNIIKYYFSRSK